MIKNRALSFLIMFLIYAATVCLSIFLWPLFNFDYWIKLLVIDVLATVFVFIFSLIFRNASVYDPYWSVQPIIFVVIGAIIHGVTVLGILLLVAVCYWGIRLTANWAYTFKGLTHQDWRYTMLNEKSGVFYPVINFVGIHMVPTLVVYFCILPAIVAFHNKVELNPFSIIFIALSIIAPTIQLIADIQMHTFRKNGGTGFIRTGLWKHGRHPNYLGEILMWWGIGLACFISMPDKWYLLSGAFANTLLFLCVSIPMAENHQARKPGFEEYKKETRVFI
ncbi:MAG: DUF1295 domain-containing protein [Treponema sp.]|uniref:DUF1295 domain-containing protein n=1 Tax=Treponema sp. TaxID=166 RepID=UPI00298D8562|nr:DUF1295 domain-containing protein [Treponema sp.]MCQ2600327.1 DUF1295 domain-containing protein [Treponema sp.]